MLELQTRAPTRINAQIVAAARGVKNKIKGQHMVGLLMRLITLPYELAHGKHGF